MVFLGGAEQVRETQGVGFVVSQCGIDLRKQVRTIAFEDCTLQQVVFRGLSMLVVFEEGVARLAVSVGLAVYPVSAQEIIERDVVHTKAGELLAEAVVSE